MHIRLTDGTTSSTLAAGAARALGVPIGPSTLRISGPVTAQAQPRLRAKAARFRNRGNMQTSVSFRSWWEFDSVAKAEDFALSYRTLVQREGSLLMEDSNGVVSAVSDCVLLDVACAQIGCTVTVDYSIAGGAQTMLFYTAEPVGGWLRTFNPNTDTVIDALAVLATMIYDHQQGASESYTITEPAGGWLRAFDPAAPTVRNLFDVVATLATEFTGTDNAYTVASNPISYVAAATTLQDAANTLATFITELIALKTIG
jgi:hypothetical protein